MHHLLLLNALLQEEREDDEAGEKMETVDTYSRIGVCWREMAYGGRY